MRTLPLILVVACNPPSYPELDLAERLGPGEVRAGVLSDEAALFGGVAAEARAGDIKIYNDRVQFVIQGMRPGNNYVVQAGGVIDADVVRPEGQPGRDLVDEWVGLAGFGRIQDARTVAVLEPGFTGRARVLAEGPASALALIEGALESPGLIDDLGLWIRTEYVLEPDSWLLEVRTTLTATTQDAIVPTGDVLFGAAPEVAEHWEPGLGRGASEDLVAWRGNIGHANDVAVVMAAAPGELLDGGGAPGMLANLTGLLASSGPTLEIPQGESRSWTRFYGVGPDLATLSDDLLQRAGVPTEEVSGVVEAPDGPVAGARVNVLVDGAPYTLAVTDAEGGFSALVPAGSEVEVLAVGRGLRRFFDLPEGAGHWAPYAHQSLLDQVGRSLQDGAVPVPVAEGRGIGTPDDPLTLGLPGRLTVSEAEGRAFEVRAYRQGSWDSGDPALVPGGPGAGAWAIGWAHRGEVTLLLEPGDYELVAHRGLRYEQDTVEVTVAAGEAVSAEVHLPRAYEHEGWILGDPHSHASPSADGRITMVERLLVQTATGVQLHFGTDHDHIADYRPLLGILDLEDRLATIVADEVSPILRGHFNVYPVEPDPSQPNHGAWRWYHDPVEDTEAQMALLRERHPGAVLQSNHPWVGLASLSGWSESGISRPAYWSSNFDAVEILNGGNLEGLAFYLDLVNRGVLVTPVGVSDSHGHTDGIPGYSATFIGIGSDDPRHATPEALVEAMAKRRTIVSRGPFLQMSIPPGSVVEGSATLEVQALGPSWLQVDRLLLFENGQEVERVEGTEATFTLAPEQDAAYVVIAEGDGRLGHTSGRAPWAMSSAILVDVAGDGWDPPLPAP